VVWTGLIGQAFLDGYEIFGDERYLDIARSSCEFILKDLPRKKYEKGICISYVPLKKHLFTMLICWELLSYQEHIRLLREKS